MSDSFKPQPWLSPAPDGAQRPVSINTNVVLPSDASQSDAAVLMNVAGEIVDSNRGSLDRFVSNNRQQHALNQQNYMDKFSALDGMTVRHRLNHGVESVEMDVRPFGGNASPFTKADVNLDGYMVWVHGEPDYGGTGDTINGRPVKCGPFAIIMNGYLIESSYDPLLAGGYVFAFGKTALVSPSLAQDLDDANPLINDKDYREPLKLIPAPGWGEDVGNALDGSILKKQPRKLGYWVFDWLSPYNPGQYINNYPVLSSIPSFVSWSNFEKGYNGSTSPLFKNPKFTKGIYFPDTRKSILNPTGVNGVQVFSLSPATPSAIVVDLWYGEFFDRGKFRVVRQSWQVAPAPRQIVKANDFPNRYLVQTLQNVEGNYFGWTANFDLSAVYSKDVRDNLNNGPSNNIMSTLGGAYTDVSLTPQQQAIVNAWRAANVAAYQRFARDEAPILTGLLKAVTDLNGVIAQAHKLAFLMRAYTGDYTLYSDPTLFPNDAQWYTPPGSTIPLTHGTPRAPLAQPFPAVQTITTTWSPNPGSPGSYISTGVTTSTSGPVQDYWIDVTDDQDLTAYEANATNLTNSGISARFQQTGVVSDVTTGSQASGSTTETITLSYSDNPIPADSLHDKIIGPAQNLSTLEVLANTYIVTTMAAYNAALAAYNAELAKVPPDLPPFPNIGNDLSKFRYDYITIAGTKWSFTQ